MPVGSSFWIAEGMLRGEIELLGQPDEQVSGYRFAMRNQFLHGHHPLGWIRGLEVTVDGDWIDQSRLSLIVREQQIAARHLPTITDIWWQMGELAFIAVDQPGGLLPGDHDIAVTLVVSTLTHTPAIDRRNLYPQASVELGARLPLASGAPR